MLSHDRFSEEDDSFNLTSTSLANKLFTLIDKLEDVPDLDDDIDSTKQNVLVFDDVVTAKNQDAMIEYWIRSRKRNCTVFYLSQTFFKIPRTIRLNTEYFSSLDSTHGGNWIISTRSSVGDGEEGVQQDVQRFHKEQGVFTH